MEKEFESLKQETRPISNFNSLFLSLSSVVDLSKSSKIKKYVGSLHPELAAIAILLPGWDMATLLQEKIDLFLTAANKLEQLQTLHGKPAPYTMRSPALPSSSLDAMDLEAIYSKPTSKPSSSPFPPQALGAPHTLAKYCQECKKQGLCFNCLQSLDNNNTTIDGFRCPNNRLSINYKMNWFGCQKKSTIHSIHSPSSSSPSSSEPTTLILSILPSQATKQPTSSPCFVFDLKVHSEGRC